MSDYRYLSCAETAKLVRAALKTAFPMITFSVKSKTYSGGASIDVRWQDGATSAEVDAVVRPFKGASFDGMQDLMEYHTSDLNGETVRYGADFIFTERRYSAEFLRTHGATLCAEWGFTLPELVEHDGSEAYFKRVDDPAVHDQFNGQIWSVSDFLMWKLQDISTITPPAVETVEPTVVEPEPVITPTVCAICQQETASPLTYLDQPICTDCHAKASAYAAKLEARAERLHAAAEKARTAGESTLNHARTLADVIPFGQPILVGHYSEGKDRRFRERIHDTFGRGYKQLQHAADLERKAVTAEHNHAISSDDPAAVVKLQAKLYQAVAQQNLMTETNKHVRAVLKIPGLDREAQIKKLVELSGVITERLAASLLTPDFMGRIGYADYELTNNSANIRRMKQRLTELQTKTEQTVEPETVIGDIRITRDTDDNRLRLHFPGKPSETVRDFLKSRGFRWSPANMAWQRQLNNAAEYAATEVIAFAQKNN